MKSLRSDVEFSLRFEVCRSWCLMLFKWVLLGLQFSCVTSPKMGGHGESTLWYPTNKILCQFMNFDFPFF